MNKTCLATSMLLILTSSTQVARPQSGGGAAQSQEPASLVAGMEFLFDDAWIDRQVGVERVLGAAVKESDPVFQSEAVWEALGVSHFSILYDDDERKFKMWYRATCAANTSAPADGAKQPASERAVGGQQYFLCYGESTNGIRWTRPQLERFMFQGKQENNILRAVGEGDTVFCTILKDPADPDPQRRYKALGFDLSKQSNLRGAPMGHRGVCVAFSADGLAWSGSPLLVLDTADVTDSDHVLPRRDPTTGQWVGFFRPRTAPKRRFIGYSTSADFEHWTHPRMLLTPDSQDSEWTEFYGMASQVIGLWRVGAMWVFQNNPEFSPLTNELVYSRDGLAYRRAMPEQALVPLGPRGAFDSRMAFPHALIERDTEVLIYYEGRNHDHGSDRGRQTMTLPKTQPGESLRSGLGLARLPWGHFCGLRATEEGLVETKWLSNYDESGVQAVAEIGEGGFIKAEILDQFGKVIPGWGQDDSRHRAGPRGALSFYWNQAHLVGRAGQTSDKKGGVGHVVKLRFHLRNATLFGFRLAASETKPAYADQSE